MWVAALQNAAQCPFHYTDLEDNDDGHQLLDTDFKGPCTEGRVGLSFQRHPSGYPVVVEVDPTGPAASCGIKMGSIIYSICGQGVGGLEPSEIAQLLVGPPGTLLDMLLHNPAMPGQLQHVQLRRCSPSQIITVATASQQVLGAHAINKLRYDLAAFYRKVAPEKATRATKIVDDFVTRGANFAELLFLNTELGRTYGADLTGLGHTENMDLNVGGSIFSISTSTVDKFPGSLLHAARAEYAPLDSQGRVFIDRNPYLFRPIFDYMSGGTVHRYSTFADLQQAMQEAEAYGIPSLSLGLAQQLHVTEGEDIRILDVHDRKLSSIFTAAPPPKLESEFLAYAPSWEELLEKQAAHAHMSDLDFGIAKLEGLLRESDGTPFSSETDKRNVCNELTSQLHHKSRRYTDLGDGRYTDFENNDMEGGGVTL